MLITRRNFLKSSAVMVTSAAMMPLFLRRAVASTIRETGRIGSRVLVIVQLAGGNDGLNTVVPYGDDRYYDLRPDLSIKTSSVLPIDNQIGLHPGLEKFKVLWDAGDLAIVEGVGYPNQSFSHFESMHYWQTGYPGGHRGGGQDGWLGRYFNELGHTEERIFPGLAIGRRMPPELYSASHPVPIMADVQSYQIRGNPRYPTGLSARTETLLDLYDSSVGSAPYGMLLDNTVDSAWISSTELAKAHDSYRSTVVYPDSPLGKSLKLIAEAITADLGLKVGHVTIGGFDTHASQPNVHHGLLKSVADAIYAFYTDMNSHGYGEEVVVMTWSEFGRRVTPNASEGTDHGSAAPLFLIGRNVRGGLHGERPGLGRLDSNNLRFTTDYRAVYGGVLEQWLGTTSELVFGRSVAPLGDLFEP